MDRNVSFRFGSAVLRILIKETYFFQQYRGDTHVSGARSGRLTTCLAYSVFRSIAHQSLVFLDLKDEFAAISQCQVPDKKYCLYWNPMGLHGLPQNRMNPVDYIRKDNPSLVSDIKVLAEILIVSTGSAQGIYFEVRARIHRRDHSHPCRYERRPGSSRSLPLGEPHPCWRR